MPKNLIEFLTALAKKSGIKTDDEKVEAFLKTEGLDKIEVPDELTVMDNKLITIDDAKNNHPDIIRHYKRQILAPVDKKIENLLAEVGLDDQMKAEILGETNSYERVQLLAKAIQAHESKKGVTDKEARDKFKKDIDELNRQIREGKAALETERETGKKAIKDFKLAHAKSMLFGDYKTVYDELPSDVKLQTLSILLDKSLAEKDAVIDFEGETGVLTLKKRDGSNYYSENNTQLTHKQFVEKVLSDNKILKVTQQQQGSNNNTQGQSQQNGGGNNYNNGQNQSQQNGNGNGNTNTGKQLIRSLNEQAMNDIKSAASPV